MAGESTDVARQFGDRAHGGNPRIEEFEPHRLPDATGGGVDPPVPAEVRRHLPNRVIGVVVHVGAVAELEAHPVGVTNRGRKCHREAVLAGGQSIIELQPIGPVHVGNGRHLDSVELNAGRGVEPLKHQCPVVVWGIWHVEVQPILPVTQADPGEQTLVVVNEGVGD